MGSTCDSVMGEVGVGETVGIVAAIDDEPTSIVIQEDIGADGSCNTLANTTSNFPRRSYRFYTGNSIYEFGHGLSYSTFSNFIISGPPTIIVQLTPTSKATTLPNIISNGQAIDLSTINCNNLTRDLVIGVRNKGPRDGTHVVLVFWKPARSAEVNGAPNVKLVGFERVEVKRGKTESVTVKSGCVQGTKCCG
ncbi:putative beta-D-xylosidase 5 [Fagus crenata]